MSEVLIFSDLHSYCHKRKNERLEDCLKIIDWVFDVAEERGIKNILFGGDLYHDRQKIEVYTYQRTFETLEKRLKSKKFQIYLLLGNHDLWWNDKTSISSVIPLSSLPGIKIIANPERINIEGSNWDFIPFTLNPVDALEQLKKLPGNAEYALGHIAIDSAVLHGTQYSDVSVEHDGDMVIVGVSLFSHYKHTFLGHYHAEQRVNDTVEYIGSPLQLSFGEAFQEKHIIAFDGKTGKKDYIINKFSPVHLVLKEEDLEKHDLKNNFVKIKVDISATDLISLRKKLLDNNDLGSLEIKQEKKHIEEHVIKDAKAILYKDEEMITKWVDEVGTGKNNLNREKLIKIGRNCTQELN